MRGTQVFPSWITKAKAKLGDGDTTVPPIREGVQETILADDRLDMDLPVKDQSYLKAPRIVYKGHQMPVRCIGYLVVPDSERSVIFSGGEDKLIFAWSLKSGEKIAELRGHTQRVTCLATFNREGSDPCLISASWDERLRIWPLKDVIDHSPGGSLSDLSDRVSSKSVVLKGHTNRVFGIAVVDRPGEAPFVVSGSSDNTLRVWSLPDGAPMYVLEDEEDVTWNLCVSSWSLREAAGGLQQGVVLLAGCKNSTVRVWNHRANWAQLQAEQQQLHAAETHPQSSMKAAIDLLSGAKQASARTVPDVVIAGHTSSVHSIVPFEYQDQPLVATACKDFDIRIFSLTTGKCTFLALGVNSTVERKAKK
jgi:WD40 repeat protein